MRELGRAWDACLYHTASCSVAPFNRWQSQPLRSSDPLTDELLFESLLTALHMCSVSLLPDYSSTRFVCPPRAGHLTRRLSQAPLVRFPLRCASQPLTDDDDGLDLLSEYGNGLPSDFSRKWHVNADIPRLS